MTKRRLAIITAASLSVLIMGGIAFWATRTPQASNEETTVVLDAAGQLANQMEEVLSGKSTRLYFADFAIDDQLLLELPIEKLVAASAKAAEASLIATQADAARHATQSAPDDQDEDSPGIEIPTDSKPDTLGVTARDAQPLPKLDTVIVDQGVITDTGLATLARLPDLEHLRLRLSPITDDGIQVLAGCEKLWLVNLPHSRLTSAGIRGLKSLPKLKQLRLGSPNLNNESCRAIAELNTLRSLHLIRVPVSDEGLKILATLPRLESLYLDDAAVTDTGWTWLFENYPHLHVHINQRHHDRDPKAHKHTE